MGVASRRHTSLTVMAAATLLTSQRPFPLHKFNEIGIVSHPIQRTRSSKTIIYSIFKNNKAMAASLLGAAGFALTLVVEPASAAGLPLMMGSSSLPLYEPPNALSLPTWAIHVSSVVEWVTAMALVWQYGEKSGYESWKGLSWGMVPLLGGAFCACTWHFFYNSEALEGLLGGWRGGGYEAWIPLRRERMSVRQVLVALQAALTVIGNATMCFAAFRIYKSSGGSSKNP
ncbi:unnamed protein product [Camellia sinensis]